MGYWFLFALTFSFVSHIINKDRKADLLFGEPDASG